jgi:hypothetical protein
MKNKTGLVFFYYFAFISFIFGVKLWLISKYANATPFWDQWDAEADLLYKPFINHSLKFSFLFSPHNEHRILTTRLLSLFELMANGIWNPLLQMVVNAGLHIAVMVIAITFIIRVIGRGYLPPLLAFSALLFGLPLGWENTLAGFQAQFYFVLLFSILSLWFTTTQKPFSTGWHLGFLFSILAFFSLASGIFCMAAAAAIGFIFYFLNLRKTYPQLGAALFMAGLFIAGVALTPVLGYHQNLKANSLAQFIEALYHVLFWPAPNPLLGLFQNTPVLVFCVLMLKRRPAANDPKWFLTVLIIWMLGVESSIAYGRASDPFASRYLDLFTISILINFSCALVLFEELKTKWKKWPYFMLITWVLTAGVSLQLFNAAFGQKGLRWYSGAKIDQEINTKAYVQTGNISYLNNKEFIHIPYPDPQRLALLLDTPEIRSILPSNIAPPDRPIKEGRFDKVVNLLIANYSVFMGIGLLSAVICGLLGLFASAKKSEKISV